ncbi:MAG: ammonium transporter [Candidatus Dadabacteria bacterium]|nr:ammonium transporter [Candidatus Dadabacteria bacterium]MXZ48296.1 ammonium transporter [Candidatus Dadabacteria bacterium]MYB27074.1 ammonium transporter [Candidatus Dadabacteria bacterium]MYE61614.1 ammonium transporter [Candidatus Dadabacteria bacterium]MYI73599.1 ammonium transporter [Candidatus Dadabacteria bacterium]
MSLKKTLSLLVFFFVLAFFSLTDPASASELDTGDTAWILTSTALVLFMTIPGLALFYGGLVGKKNVLSLLMQCFSITAVVTVIWTFFGYSMAFDTTGMVAGEVGMNAFVGGFSKAFLNGVGIDTLSGTIPEVLFFAFQLTFAIITPALIIGAFAERMKFSAMLLFTALWVIFCYFPIAHMVWGGEGSYLGDKGVIDFAGGIVVHITAGTAALVAAILVGPRRGYPRQLALPHNLTLTMIGTAMLWVGWFGFNGGSALAAGGQAAMAVVVTQISPCVAALTWIFLESVRSGKPSALGFATGAIAGLAAITPASGTVGPLGAIVIGCASSVLAYIAATYIKFRFNYDDALDVVGVHGVGGLVGIILVGVFASNSFGGSIVDLDIGAQLGIQIYGGIFAVVYTAIVSYIVLKVVDMLVGLRVTEDEETEGLDITDHGESGYYGI